MTETVIPDRPEAFLESLRTELGSCTPAHHVSFAAVLAERRLASIGEDADWEPRQGASMRQILDAVWGHVCGRTITPAQLSGFEADLSEIGVLIDPDRYFAYRSYRANWLLGLATRCCAPGAEVAAAVAVARASLVVAAGSGPSWDYESDWILRKEWMRPDVQAEASLQSKLARALRATPRIGRDVVSALRRDFVT